MAQRRVLIILADGFEEIEAMGPADILRRAGIDVMLAGLSAREVTSARGVKILADSELDKLNGEVEVVVFPGGSLGAKNLSKSEKVKTIIKEMHGKKKIIAAICASPAVVLAPTGILNGKKATCYPGMEDMFSSEVTFSDEAVVVDKNVITSRGPGTACLFGIKLAERLV